MLDTKELENESQRIAKLMSYDILDTGNDPLFDDLVFLAKQFCNVPVALISFVDKERQWFKSRLGTDLHETERNISFCQHAIKSSGIFMIENALDDPRFQQNPLVIAGPKIRFYAGAPLETDDGFRLGTLCVIDTKANSLTWVQQQALIRLAKQVMSHLERRKQFEEVKKLADGLHEAAGTIEEQRLRLLKSSQMVNVAEMNCNIAHEINNPLAIIKGHTDKMLSLMQKPELDLPLLVKSCAKINETTMRVHRIIRGMLGLSRQDQTKNNVQKLPFNELIQQSLELVKTKIRHSEINFTCETNSPAQVHADVIQFQQAFFNIVNNACYAIQNQPEKSIRVGMEEQDNYVSLFIEDNGPGINLEDQQKVMNAFFTTKPIGEGTGLGLSLAKKIVANMGGELSYDKQYSKGARFLLKLKKVPA